MISGVLLAESDQNNSDWGKAGPVALLLLLLFVVACVFLFRSMFRRVRRVPASFDDAEQTPEPQRMGTARPVIPQREGDDSYAARNDPPPRLGTPDDLVAGERAKRQERIRKAKQRRGKK